MFKKTRVLAVTAALLITATALWATGDYSALHPPAGHHMALVVFEDLQCPACASADPLLLEASRKYGIPLVRHDFIIPSHPWSKEAHIIARYFDSIKPQLGEEYRQYIFKNQSQVVKPTLRKWSDDFAAAHHTALPAFYDPKGEFKAKVEADTELGKNTGPTGVKHTPTIWVVTDSGAVPPREVAQQSDLFTTIDAVKAAMPPEAKSTKSAKKK